MLLSGVGRFIVGESIDFNKAIMERAHFCTSMMVMVVVIMHTAEDELSNKNKAYLSSSFSY